MKEKLLTYLMATILVVFGAVSAYAQEDEDIEIFDDKLFDDEEVDFNFFDDKPVFEILYGVDQASIHEDAFSSKFNRVSSLEGKFGYLDKEPNMYESKLFSYDLTYFSLGYYSQDLHYDKENDSRKFDMDTWQFGFGEIKGYGWDFTEKSNLLLYTGGAITWSGVDYSDSLLPVDDQKLLDRFADGVRFGDYWEGGIKLQVYEPFAITAAFQRQVIMPRVLFWKWTGSQIVRAMGEYAVNYFTEDIIEASPTFGPIFNLLLNSAYNFGWYELSKKKMNWPFDTETPMIFDGYKLGATFTF